MPAPPNQNAIRRVLKVIQADFGQECSTDKLKHLLAFPRTWRTYLRGFVMPVLVPIGILSVTWIPLDPPNQGFHGRNRYTLLMGTVSAVAFAFVMDTRLVKIIPTTQLDRRQRFGCALALIVSVVIFSVVSSFIQYPVPFGKSSLNL